ncbi:pyridoxal-phosphate dependent enzyme [Brevibacillus humidisoli]|uniref:pyridoxal-phosphate dependent enzyme n=1 Tax=Brevibacillus humidisoli TaxID=2895522 RepID=UPI001E5966A3|nr:pyridoxal-phosphate dependent enzyme [Brevibacillus humidisoli]UFJ43132.1 pyridoxal-phosphate dependent enzyme [Brevibacillus humidisoli]
MTFLPKVEERRLGDFAGKLGNTPIMEVPSTPGAGKILAKCEWHNPTGSVKDRTAYAMMAEVLKGVAEEEQERLHILEYSGGNLGLSLATICHLLQIKLTLVLSNGANKSLLASLQSLGANVKLVDKQKGFWGVMETTFQLSDSDPSYTFLYQHRNEANFHIHKNETGKEILEQVDGKIDAWVASIGTGGTLMGVYETLSSKFPDMELHAVTPAELPYGSEQPPNGLRKYAGSGGLGCGRKQLFVERKEQKVTRHWTYSFQDTLVEMRRFYEETGVKIGTSAAANLLAARRVAELLGSNAVVVTVFPDAGSPEEWEAAYG